MEQLLAARESRRSFLRRMAVALAVLPVATLLGVERGDALARCEWTECRYVASCRDENGLCHHVYNCYDIHDGQFCWSYDSVFSCN
jgi:hypothetical protein